MGRVSVVCSVVALLALSVVAVSAQPEATATWPRFRGLTAGSATDNPALPETWSETENVAWKTPVPGLGWSSPVVWHDHIFLTSALSSGEEPEPVTGLYDPGEDFGSKTSTSSHRWIVYDVDFGTGAIRWETELANRAPPIARHLKNSYASETPLADGERVYVYFGSIGLLAALDHQGQVIWQHDNLGANNGWQAFGTAASPALHNGRLYIVTDNTVNSYLAAFDAATGEELWRVVRDEVENWSSPFVWENDVRTEIVTTGRGSNRSYDLEGNLLWEVEGMTANVVPTPFARDGLVYLSSGYPGGHPRPVYAIRAGASGNISLNEGENANDYVVWFQPLLGTYSTSALVHDGIYYTLLDRGFLLAHDARTGQEIYGRRRLAPGHGFTASPWAYNGKVFALSEDGETFVVRAGREFEVVGRNVLNEMALATPAVVGDSLVLRTQRHLYRIARQ